MHHPLARKLAVFAAFAIAAVSAVCAGLSPAVAEVRIEVNRPRSPFDCDTPRGRDWFGSEERCLEELCGGHNVTNEYVFDADGRSRRNPCYGQDPTRFDQR